MLRAVSLGFASLSDSGIMRILLKVAGLTLLALIVLGTLLWFALNALFGWIGLAEAGLLSAVAVTAVLVIAGLILFRTIAVAITWVFSDDIIDIVEARHYPFEAAQGVRPTNAQSLRMGLHSAWRALAYNLLALPVYLILLVTGIGAPLLFLGVNALLLGKDLEDMLTARHGKRFAGFGKGERLLLGGAGAGGMMIPVVQFIIPVVATAAAVHMAHDRKHEGIR